MGNAQTSLVIWRWRSRPWQGVITIALFEALSHNPDHAITIVREVTQQVIAERDFALGELTLLPLTQLSGASLDKKGEPQLPPRSVSLCDLFVHEAQNARGWSKAQFSYPIQSVNSGCSMQRTDPFMPAFWGVQSTVDPREINCKHKTVKIDVKVGKAIRQVVVPTIAKPKAIREGDEVIVQGSGEVEAGAAEKRKAQSRLTGATWKASKPKGKAKGNGDYYCYLMIRRRSICLCSSGGNVKIMLSHR